MKKRRRGNIVTIGSFDGLHQGHAALVDRAVTEARKRGLRSRMLTFDVPPRMVLEGRRPAILSTGPEKEILARDRGVEVVERIGFTREFSATKPFFFFRNALLRRRNARGLVVGLDFRFGVHRSAGAKDLVRWGIDFGIPVWVIPPVTSGGAAVSSTRIREAIERGRYRDAVRLLGHPYLIAGPVVSGRGMGRKIGFPTINLNAERGKLLPRGVFAVRGWALRRVAGRWQKAPRGAFWGVCNVGQRPTFLRRGAVTVEVHVLGGALPDRNRTAAVELVSHLRRERRFPSSRALARAIARDIARTRALFRRERSRKV